LIEQAERQTARWPTHAQKNTKSNTNATKANEHKKQHKQQKRNTSNLPIEKQNSTF